MKRESEYRLLDSRLCGNDNQSMERERHDNHRVAYALRSEKRGNDTHGFTLVEILTTIAIIGILLAFLIPALSMVEKSAVKVKQRAQFHGIEVALEAFSTDTGDYPPSAWDHLDDGIGAYYGMYSASQRLAEAIIGQDGFGFHPDSRYRFDGRGDIDGDGILEATTLYDAVNDTTCSTGYVQTAQENLSARKGPYLELENANAVKLSNLYGVGKHGALVDTYVLADMYKITKNLATGKMAGSPILYYKANRTKVLHDGSSDVNIANSTYNVCDSIGVMSTNNDSIVDLRPLATKLGDHPMSPFSDTGFWGATALFYNATRNPNFTSPPRPYRSESFLLQSAGPDSLYGTADDVFNFDSEK